jgi:MFS family permease
VQVDEHTKVAKEVPPRTIPFAALRNKGFRGYFTLGLPSMMGDNVEHVISYWVLFQAFHSPALAGFAVISHWAPFLFLGVHAGILADRFDCRKIIQATQITSIGLALSWSFLFLTGNLQVWHAVILLLIHGLAGAFRAPASQIIIHDIVGPEHLQSAIRLNAISRHLALLAGPAIGGGLLVTLGPSYGLMVNAALFLPLSVWLITVPYTGHLREGIRKGEAKVGLLAAMQVLKDVAGNRTIVTMIALSGLSSVLVGSAFQAQMPQFAQDLGTESVGMLYSMLLAAHGAGAAVVGLALEGTGLFKPRAYTAIFLAGLWCIAIIVFAAAPHYSVALAALFVGGGLNLGFSAMSMTLVQLEAPPQQRGRVIGLFNMSQLGLRVGSGMTVGVLGAWIGIHWSLGLSATVLLTTTVALFALVGLTRRSVAAPRS